MHGHRIMQVKRTPEFDNGKTLQLSGAVTFFQYTLFSVAVKFVFSDIS